jgi:hypothetical protein
MALGPVLRPLAGPCQPGTANACMARSCHAPPWLEWAQWRAHHRLNAGENLEQVEGKWSLDIGLRVATRKPRRGGWEGGCSPMRRSVRWMKTVSTGKYCKTSVKGPTDGHRSSTRTRRTLGHPLSTMRTSEERAHQ